MSTTPITAQDTIAQAPINDSSSEGKETKGLNVQYLMYDLIGKIKEGMEDEQTSVAKTLTDYKDVIVEVQSKLSDLHSDLVDKQKRIKKILMISGISMSVLMGATAMTGSVPSIACTIAQAVAGFAGGAAKIASGKIETDNAQTQKDIDIINVRTSNNSSFRSNATNTLVSDIKLENQMMQSYSKAQDNVIDSKHFKIKT